MHKAAASARDSAKADSQATPTQPSESTEKLKIRYDSSGLMTHCPRISLTAMRQSLQIVECACSAMYLHTSLCHKAAGYAAGCIGPCMSNCNSILLLVGSCLPSAFDTVHQAIIGLQQYIASCLPLTYSCYADGLKVLPALPTCLWIPCHFFIRRPPLSSSQPCSRARVWFQTVQVWFWTVRTHQLSHPSWTWAKRRLVLLTAKVAVQIICRQLMPRLTP